MYKCSLSGKEQKPCMHKNLVKNIRLSRVTNSKRDSRQYLLKITVASHVLGTHANKSPGIDMKGGGEGGEQYV